MVCVVSSLGVLEKCPVNVNSNSVPVKAAMGSSCYKETLHGLTEVQVFEMVISLWLRLARFKTLKKEEEKEDERKGESMIKELW